MVGIISWRGSRVAESIFVRQTTNTSSYLFISNTKECQCLQVKSIAILVTMIDNP